MFTFRRASEAGHRRMER